MYGLHGLKGKVKRTSAIILATLLTASCAQAALSTADAAEVTETPSSAASVLSNEDRGVIYANSRTDFRDESIYFLITTRFYDGDTSNNARTSEDTKAQNPENDPSWRGDFKGLIDKLDYIKALGFTAIWITPVVENDSGYDYHGYHAYDFSAVDTRYESNGVTYQTLIDACHAKGMKVIQDVVLNHTCNWGERNLLQIDNPIYAGGRSDYVMPAGVANDPESIYHHNGFCGGPDFDNYAAQNKTIADDCFDLETENPKVYNYLVDCYTNYINMGVDAFRVDTVKHISRLTLNSVFVPAFKAAGGDDFYMFGEVCTKGHDVWYRGEPPISTCFYTWAETGSWANCWTNDLATNESLVESHYAAHSDTSSQPTSNNAFLDGNDYHTPDYSQRSGMDVIDFQMHWSFMNANNAFNTALGEDKYFNDSTWNVVYVDSHDYAPDECQTQRYTGGTDAWAENLSLMFTFRGIPCIFYGSEIEFQAGKPIDVGPNAALQNTGRAYYGDNIEGNVDTSDFTVFGNVEGVVGDTLNATLSQHIMRLNRIRQAIPALRKGQYSTEGCNGNMAFKRRYVDSSTDSFACVAISGGATFSGVPNGKYVDAVTGDVQNVSNGTLSVSCSGKGNMRVYVLDTAKTPAPGRVITNGDYLTDGGAAEKIGPVDIYVVQVPVESVTLNKTSLTVMEGTTEALTATIAPSDATNKTITWTSSDTSVATVAGGKVSGVSIGTATITAKSNNGKTATCQVTVTENTSIVKPTGISLNKSSMELTAGDSESLTATVAPADATNKTVTWTSDNTSVATVDSNGTVKAVAQGSATITASTFNGKTASCTVTVAARSFEYVDKGFYFEKPSTWGSNINVYFFNKASNTTVGQSWPGTSMTNIGDGIYSLEYTNTDSNVVMIFNDGSNQSPGQDQGGFEIIDQGYYTINGYDHTVEKVTTVDVTSVSLNTSSLGLTVGNTQALTATVAPSNATNKTITWTSSNTSVATVSSSGVVTANAAGTAVITAKSNNGKTATCSVTVSSGQTEALANNSTISATSITVGSSVTVTAKASGGTAPYKYTYQVKRASASDWTTKASKVTDTSMTFTLSYPEAYSIKVFVIDSTGASLSKTFSVSVNGSTTSLTNSSTVSSTSVVQGTTVTVTGKASGGTSPYKYTYHYKKSTSSDWSVLASKTTSTTVSFTPGYTGEYTVKAYVIDSTGKTVSKTFTVTVNAAASALTNSSTVSADSVKTGTAVTVTGKATGGTSPYKYTYQIKRASVSAWTTKASNTSSTTMTFTPGYAETYNVKVIVTDAKGTTATKTMNVAVTAASTGLTNNSTISATTITKGSAVTVTAKASSGTSPYKYTYQYKRTTASDWTTLASKTSETSKTITFNYTGTYTVKAYVIDSTGKTVSKTFTVEVTAK